MDDEGGSSGWVPGRGRMFGPGRVGGGAGGRIGFVMGNRGGNCRVKRGMGSFPSSMLPSLPNVADCGSRENFSRASTQRAARGHTSRHSLRILIVLWSIIGPSRTRALSWQTGGFGVGLLHL